MPNTTQPSALLSIDSSFLTSVIGGASRVSGRSGNNDQITQMLTQVTASIKDLGAQKQTGMDPMMMMMMMGMGGGGGGGGAQQVAAAPPPPPAQPNVNVSVRA